MMILLTATVGGLFLAIFAGRAIAQGNYNMLAMVAAAGLGAAVFIATGKNAYILLAIATGMTGSIGILPLPFSYQELMIAGGFGITLALLAFKRLHLENRWGLLDVILFLNIAYLITVYARNPVGFRALGTETVGARPYLVVFVAVLFYLAMSQYKLPPKLAPKFPLIIAGPVILLSSIGVVAYFVPGLSKVIYPFWTGVGVDRSVIEAAGGTTSGPARVGRVPTMLIGSNLLLLLCAYMPVASFLSPMNPAMFFFFLVAVASWLASGFRSGSLVYAAYMFFSCWLRRRLHDLLPAIGVGVLFICLLIVGQGTLFDLPTGMQRSLSFLPGNWDHDAVSDAEGSTEWRLQIWEEVLQNDQFIKNKLLGDGFGYSAYDLKIQLDAMLGGTGYMDGTEAQAITGAYHSGPLSTIRYVGVIGLLLYFLMQLGSFFYSIRLVRKAWKTPYQPIALFLAVPQFYAFFSFYLIFGGFDSDFPRSIFTLGLLKFVDLSLADFLEEKRAASQPEPPAATNLPAPASHPMLRKRGV